MKPIGIFGGTFAPPHNGHVAAADAFLRGCDLERLYIIPTAIPPHKRIGSSDNPAMRLEMVRLAFCGHPRYRKEGGIFLSDYEILRADKSYTVHTLRHFAALYANPLIFLCGADMFVTLDHWYRAEEIFKLASIAYIPRSGIETEDAARRYAADYGARLIRLDMPPCDVSSTDIRERIHNGEDPGRLVPAGVAAYITQNHLYAEG